VAKRRKQTKRPSEPREEQKPSVAVLIAMIGAAAVIIGALVNYMASVKAASIPVEATQTANVLHTSVALTASASLIQPTNTFTSLVTPSPTSTPTQVSPIAETNAATSPTPTSTTNATGLTLIRTIQGAKLGIAAAISSDGSMLALAVADGTIKVLSTSEDRLIGNFRAGTGILSLAFSPDNQKLAAGLASTTVKVWRLNDGFEYPALEGLTGGVFNVAFSPDGQIVAASAKPDLILWHVGDGTPLQKFTDISAIYTNIAFSPDGSLIASGFETLTVRIWQVHNGQALHDLEGAHARTLAFSRNGEILATLGQSTTLNLWRVQDGGLIPPALTGHTHTVESLAFSKDSQTLLTVSRDIEVRRWQMSDHQRLYTLNEDGSDVRLVLLSADGATLMALYAGDTVKIWQIP
jgi:WD40 repeat protein